MSWTATVVGRCSLALLFVLVLAGVLPSAHSAPPEFMTYQGFLVDANGSPLAATSPANYPVVFRIFTAATGGTRLWSEQQIVTVDNGNFSVILGEGTPVGGESRPVLSTVLAGPNNADRYMSLSVTVGATTSEMLPRLRLLPAPYAFTASSATALVQPNGSAAISYANNQVEVAGNLFSSGVIAGNGSGLTGLTAGQIPPLNASVINAGTLADARLSGNVARRDVGNAFNGNQTITGNLGLGTATPLDRLQIGDYATASSYLSIKTGGGNLHQSGIKFRHFNDTIGFDIVDSEATPNGLNFIRYAAGAGASAMYIDRFSGNVGLGTTTPGAKLTVIGGASVAGPVSIAGATSIAGSASLTGGNTLEFGAGVAGKESSAGKIGYQAYSTALDVVGAGTTTANRRIKFWAEGGTEFSGRVGISTATPRVPLDVRGSVNFTLTATQADTSIDVLDAFGLANGPSAVNKAFSILAEQHVGAVGFVASSDRRIKTGITTSPTAKDLAAIQQLRVAEYRMTDTMTHGAAPRKGFIAQEVERVIPQAVSRSSDFIPDIYVLATNAFYTASTKTLALSLGKPHELQVGDRVRLHLDRDRRDLTVAGVLSPCEFVVEGCEQSPEKVFVYGREVDDFRAVDYDQIFTASVGAIQELAAKVHTLESENKRIAQLEKDAAETELKHKSAISKLHHELDGLKQLVQQMAAARTAPQNGAAAPNAEAVVSGPETVANR